ncbi:hypothetical protein IAT38_001288 [Cryptococcus sp. DSM 104549]
MGKKKRSQVFVLKPWCWYCEREFEDDKVLLQHQKSKHFKCQLCPRKLNYSLTNTLPGRDGYDIEIFGMEGVPANALDEWKTRKEAEAGTAALVAAAAGKRPKHSYAVIPEADLRASLAQHKILMENRNKAAPVMPFPPFAGAPPFPPPGPPPGFRPPFPPVGMPGMPPFPPRNGSPFPPASSAPGAFGAPPPLAHPVDVAPPPTQAVDIQPAKDGVMWPDVTASPWEKRSQQPRYRYLSPTPGEESEEAVAGRKRKAAADFL